MIKSEILLVAVGQVPADITESLTLALPKTFGLACRTGPPLPHPTYAWNAKRRQYLADAILDRLQAAENACALAVADLDLYVPDLNFVFGLADQPNRRAIIALPRLRQGYYHVAEDLSLFTQRVQKEAVHELGHVFGLRHCDDRRCVMSFSNSLADTDYKHDAFCSRCIRQLKR